MYRGRLTLAAVLTALLLLCASNGFAQQGFGRQTSMVHTGAPGSSQGNLTVTATVVASVGVVIGPDGEQRLIVANAADPNDNVSFLQAAPTAALTDTGSSAIGNASKKKKKH